MKIINKLRDSWNDIPNSVKFWNGLVLLILIVIGVIDIEILSGVLLLGSILAVGVFLDGKSDSNPWIWFTPVIWILLLFASIFHLCDYIGEKIIEPFNDWLNKKSDKEDDNKMV